MFAQHTIEAIVALASIDAGVTARDMDGLADVLSGRMRKTAADMNDGIAFVRYGDAAKALDISVPTVKKYAKEGLLVKVMGAGRYALGLTPESIREFKKRQTITYNRRSVAS